MKSVVLDRFWGRQTRGWNQIDKTSWRKCPSWVSACLDWAAYMGLLSEFGQRTPNLLPSSYIHWEFQMAIKWQSNASFSFSLLKRLGFLSLFLSFEEVIVKMLRIILTSPSHAIWWVEGQCCEKQQSERMPTLDWLFYAWVPIIFKPTRLNNFHSCPFITNNMQARDTDYHHHESVRGGKFKAEMWI